MPHPDQNASSSPAPDIEAYQLLLQAPVALVVFRGRENIIEFVNELFLPIAGKTRAELLGRPAFDVMPAAAEQGFVELLERIRATGEPVRLEEHETRIERSGRLDTAWLNIVYQPVREPDGRIERVMILVTDVTGSVESRRKLEASEQQLNSLANAMPQLVWMADPEGRVTYYNDRVADFMGARKNEDGSWSWEGMLHPDDAGPTWEAWNAAVRKGQLYQMEHRVQLRDGSFRWLLSRAQPLRDEAGRILRWYGTATDIHAIKLSEEDQAAAAESILASERRFRGTFESAAIGIAHVAPDGQWLMVNDRLCAIVGYSRTELLELDFQHITHPDDLEADLAQARALLRGEITTYTMEKRYIHKSGDPVWINLTASLMRNETGEPEFFIAFVEDITAEKIMREQAQKNEDQFRILANSISQLAWMADGDGWIYWYNDRWYAYTGTDFDEMQGWGWEKVHHPEHIDRVVHFVKEAWGRPEPWELTFPLRRHDGEFQWFLTRAYPVLDSDGRVQRWIGTNTNINDQKRFAERLESLVHQRTRELQNSNDDLRQFAHVASHDLKEPVRKIRTFAGRLQDDPATRFSEQGKLFLQKIENAAERMYNMIEGVLSYSVLNASGEIPSTVSLKEVVETSLSDLEILIQEKQAQVVTGPLPEVVGAPVLLQQLFYNLLNNSLKFSRAGVPPEIRIRQVDAPEDGFVRIEVQDNGIGFEPELAGKIFETFTRLHSKDKFEGTGLGLSLCRKIVERHGGRIAAQGHPGEGATFSIDLPLQQNGQI